MSGFTPKVRTTIRSRADDWCEVCGHVYGHQIHHRRPRGSGGSSRPDTDLAANGLLVCAVCHRMIESYRQVALMLGWLVSQYDSPAETAVVYRGRRVLLDDLGNMREAA